MKKFRSLVEFFNKSTQATTKLKQNQANSTVPEYKNQATALGVLQDVVTRWWSTFRSLRRGRYLKKSIKALIAAEEVNCPVLSDEEWMILHQVEIVLTTMAGFQRTLEGEAYVTSSLVVAAVYRVRESYKVISGDEHALPVVKQLAKLLLADFNERYHPASDGESVMYLSKAEIGRGNRYITVHPYFFVASLLDPRTKNMLPSMMTDEDFEQLCKDLKSMMLMEKKVMRGENSNANKPDESSEDGDDKKQQAEDDSEVEKSKDDGDEDEDDEEPDIYDQMFAGLDTEGPTKEDDSEEIEPEEELLKAVCEEEFDRFMKKTVSLRLRKKKQEGGEYNDPLAWWKEEQAKYPTIARLAREFLAIPATSAPSERVWSRAAQVLTHKRSKIKSALSERIMFIRENSSLLHKHYAEIAKKWKDKKDHWIIAEEQKYLPPIYEAEELDVGQRDHCLFSLSFVLRLICCLFRVVEESSVKGYRLTSNIHASRLSRVTSSREVPGCHDHV